MFRDRSPLRKRANVVPRHRLDARPICCGHDGRNRYCSGCGPSGRSGSILVEPPGACIPAKSSTFVNHDRTICLDAGLRGGTVVRTSCVLPSLSPSVLLRYSLRFSMVHSSRDLLKLIALPIAMSALLL